MLKKESIQWIGILFLNYKMNQESTIRENSRIVRTLTVLMLLFLFSHFQSCSKNNSKESRVIDKSHVYVDQLTQTSPNLIWRATL